MGLFSSVTSAFKNLAGFLGPVGDVLSPISTAYTVYDKLSGSSTKAAQSAQAAANRQMVELSNTAYQRAMADMKKAGLNPILAGKLGGASTPNIMSEFTQVPQVMQASAAQQQANTAQSQMLSNLGVNEQQIQKLAAEVVGVKQFNELKEVLVQFIRGSDLAKKANQTGADVGEVFDTVVSTVKTYSYEAGKRLGEGRPFFEAIMNEEFGKMKNSGEDDNHYLQP